MATEISKLAAPPSFLVSAIRRVLTPLVRLLLAKGITYPFLAELLKSVYVDVARKEFHLDTKRLTYSRITTVTGVHRQDVKRMADPGKKEAIPNSISLGARIVTHWISQPEYLNRKGRPAPLARLAAIGGAKSFEALTESVSKNIRPRTVLDELLRLGIARLDEEDRVCLKADAFVPESGLEEKSYYFGQNIHDHMAAAVHNLLDQTPPFIDRSLVFEKLSSKSVEELRTLATELGMRALQTVYKRARALEKIDAKRFDIDMQISFGVYFFSQPGNVPLDHEQCDETDSAPPFETPSDIR